MINKNSSELKKIQANALLSKKYKCCHMKDPIPDALADVESTFGSPALFLGSNYIATAHHHHCHH